MYALTRDKYDCQSYASYLGIYVELKIIVIRKIQMLRHIHADLCTCNYRCTEYVRTMQCKIDVK